jgi:hypothetical protein
MSFEVEEEGVCAAFGGDGRLGTVSRIDRN